MLINKLKQIRKEKKITLINMSNQLGINTQSLRNYETHKRQISAKLQDDYATILGYEVRLLKI